MRLRSQSDDQLVALARAGDEAAFEAIVVRYRWPLLRHAQRILPDAAAEDAVQQAFLSAWSALRRGDDVRELSAWLHRIQHNVALNGLRAQRGEHAELTEAVAAGRGPQEELERRMAMRQTLAGVAALPERQREAVLGVAVQGRSQEEVARTLGLSHGAVGALVMRGRRTLRAAANALTPPWVVEWFARLSEAPVAKVAAVVVVTGAATGPIVVQHREERPQAVAKAAAPERAKPERRDAAGGAPGPARTAAPEIAAPPRRADEGQRGDSSGAGSGRARPGGPAPGGSGSNDGDSSGPGSGEADDLDSSGSDSSGSGSGDVDDHDSSGSGSSGSGSSGSGSSGSSGSGSGSSDSSGSGTSGTGTSGSGSSGSGSSGSGSSGSGSSGSELAEVDDSSGSGSSGSELTVPDDSSGSGSSGSGGDDD